MSYTTLYKAAFKLLGLSILCTVCRGQSLSIISDNPMSSPDTSTHFTPNGPSSSFDSLGTGTSTSHTTTIIGLSEPTFAPTITTCFIPPTGTVPTTQVLNPSESIQPAGAECLEIIRASGHIIEVGLFTVAADGQTLPVSAVAPVPAQTSSSSSSSSSSSGSGIGTGAIVGAVIGSVFGALLIVATIFWIRKQRRSSKPVGTWLNRPAGWVRDEKQSANVIEMSRRNAV